MTEPNSSGSRGKWVALILVTAGVLAALAEWRFRPPTLQPQEMPATAPSEQELP